MSVHFCTYLAPYSVANDSRCLPRPNAIPLAPAASLLSIIPSSPVLICSYILHLVGNAGLSDLEEFVNTPEFDLQCSIKARELFALSSDESGNSNNDLWSGDDSASTATTVESGSHEVSKFEGNFYYAGVGPKGRGPKLIYRTSEDKFEEPDGPEAYRRLMRVVSVPDSHEFGENGMWDRVRDKVRGLLITPRGLY